MQRMGNKLPLKLYSHFGDQLVTLISSISLYIYTITQMSS